MLLDAAYLRLEAYKNAEWGHGVLLRKVCCCRLLASALAVYLLLAAAYLRLEAYKSAGW